METLIETLKMGDYGFWVWTAYGVATLLIGGVAFDSLRSARTARRAVERLKAGRMRGTDMQGDSL